MSLFVKKPIDVLMAEAGDSEKGLKRTLSAGALVALGIGAIIGAGLFVRTAAAAAQNAGPSVTIGFIVAAIGCALAGLCYAELSSSIPISGSAYTYTYATMGEFMAWMVGWILMLEYAVGYIAVAVAWSKHLMQFLKGFESFLPACIVNPPIWMVNDLKTATFVAHENGLNIATAIPHVFGIPICFNIPAILVIIAITSILIKGTKDSTKMAGLMVFIKLAVIALFLLVGSFYVKPANWTPFAPNGMEGMFMGAFIIFFAYIGFDALATTAEECKNPQKDLPIGIIGSLIVTTIVYVLVALVITGMQSTSGSVPQGFLDAPMAYLMSLSGQDWAAGLVSIGSLAGLTSVLLVLQMAATRILYAMSRDNFLPKRFQKLHPKFHTPHILTWTVGVIAILGSLTLDLGVAASLCNFGTLTAFIIVCVAVLILRKVDPDRHRPFKVPFSPLFPSLGILCCGGLMIYSMTISKTSAVFFPIWVGLGALIYFHYGYKKNRKVEIAAAKEAETIREVKEEKEIRINEEQPIINEV